MRSLVFLFALCHAAALPPLPPLHCLQQEDWCSFGVCGPAPLRAVEIRNVTAARACGGTAAAPDLQQLAEFVTQFDLCGVGYNPLDKDSHDPLPAITMACSAERNCVAHIRPGNRTTVVGESWPGLYSATCAEVVGDDLLRACACLLPRGVLPLAANRSCEEACAERGCLDTRELALWEIEDVVRSGANWVGEARGVLNGTWARVFFGKLDEFWVGAGSSCS